MLWQDYASTLKSIIQDKPEGAFEDFLKDLKPAANSFTMVFDMFRDQWGAKEVTPEENKNHNDYWPAYRRRKPNVDRGVLIEAVAIHACFHQRFFSPRGFGRCSCSLCWICWIFCHRRSRADFGWSIDRTGGLGVNGSRSRNGALRLSLQCKSEDHEAALITFLNYRL